MGCDTADRDRPTDDSLAVVSTTSVRPKQHRPHRFTIGTGGGQLDFERRTGQRQRLGLARALYRRPEVLILDEATSALDTATETMVMDALRQLHGKLTMVVIAHRTDTLKMCDTRLEFPLGLVRAQQAT